MGWVTFEELFMEFPNQSVIRYARSHWRNIAQMSNAIDGDSWAENTSNGWNFDSSLNRYRVCVNQANAYRQHTRSIQ